MNSGNTAGTKVECQQYDYNERSALFRLTQTNEIDCSLHAIYEDKSGKRVQLSLFLRPAVSLHGNVFIVHVLFKRLAGNNYSGFRVEQSSDERWKISSFVIIRQNLTSTYHLPYIFPSSERIIFLRPQGG